MDCPSGCSEAGNSCPLSDVCTLSAEAEGRISKDSDRDAYKIELQSGRSYKIKVMKESGTFDPMLRLFENVHSTEFIADNNGGGNYQNDGDAELYYTAATTASHYIEVMPAKITLNNNPNDHTGDYRITLEELPEDFELPEGIDHTAKLPGNGLSQAPSQYELVWEDEFDTHPAENPMWGVHPSFNYGCRMDIKHHGWRSDSPSVLRIAPDSSSLYMGIKIPDYTPENVEDLRESHCALNSRSTADSGWELTTEGGTFIINRGEIPKHKYSNDFEICSNPSCDAGKKGYLTTDIRSHRQFDTRYGYFEVEVDYTNFRNRTGFVHAFWMNPSISISTENKEEASELLDAALYRGYEIDIAEVWSARFGKANSLNKGFVLHIHSANGGAKLRGYVQQNFDIDDTKGPPDFPVSEDHVFQWGIEWTPHTMCLFVNRKKHGCLQDFEIKKEANNTFVYSRAPHHFILSTSASKYGGDAIGNHEGLMQDLQSGGEGAASVKVNYLRVFKPRNRYGDLGPDVRTITRKVNNLSDLIVKEND